jgi:hypothetical protein
MARTLRINVQVDRLPDIEDAGKLWCQLGLRLSGAIVPDVADVTLDSDKVLVQPWLWRAQRGDSDGTWKAHDKANWMLWRLKDDSSDPEKIDLANWKLAVADPTTFDPEIENADLSMAATIPKIRSFHSRVNSEIDAILSDTGVRSLEVPGADGVVRGRTVFGLIESLTGLPHPVPAGMQVWTAISLDLEAFPISETDRFLAAPAFVTSADVAYAVDSTNLTSTPADNALWWVPYTSDPIATTPTVVSCVQPSLPMTLLRIASDDPQRLIDLSSLLVREGDEPAFESSDWNTTLPARIAETIDPAARSMAVLDAVIREWVERGVSYVEALRGDILPIAHDGGMDPVADYLREALAALCEPVLAPRSRSSRVTLAPAAAFLERMASNNAALWPTVVPLLFAQAGAENASTMPATPPHFMVSRARIADAAGIVPGRNDELTDDPGKTIDNEKAFSEWILRHWTEIPGAALGEGSDTHYKFQSTAMRFFLNGGEVQPVEVAATGVVDFSRMSGRNESRIVIALKLAKVDIVPAEVTFSLRMPGAPATAPNIAFKLNIDTGNTTLSINDADPESKDQTFTGGRLSIGVNISKESDPRKLTLDLEYRDAAGWKLAVAHVRGSSDPIDKTAAFGGGRLGLFVDSSQQIEVTIDPSGIATDALQQSMAGGAGQGQAFRRALSIAYAGPAIAGLMGGWVPIKGKTADSAGAKTMSLRERLIMTISEYVPTMFDDAFAAAAVVPITQAKDAENNALVVLNSASAGNKQAAQQEYDRLKRKSERINTSSQNLAHLWEVLRDAAKADALHLAEELVPLVENRRADPVTSDAPPLTFAIDQLQDFDESVDLWTRLAGLGVLIGRRGGPQDRSDEWWSLNVATLHVSRADKTTQERQTLGEDNAVPVNNLGTWPADWAKSALVDPVPLVVSEVSGVRGAMISYHSQSLIAETEKRPQLDPRGQARSVPRRPEAYLFPVKKGFPKLPPLTFGRTYDVVPYLIGHGGVIPPAFRSNIAEPTSSFPLTGEWNGSVKIPRESIITPDAHSLIRSKIYLRTVPISAPRLSNKGVWPRLFEGVAPLASELPVRPAPITLRDSVAARFFLDKEQVRGTLNGPLDVQGPAGALVEISGIRIEVGLIDLKNVVGKLVIKAQANDPAITPVTLLTVEVALSELDAVSGSGVTGLRIDVIGDEVEVSALRSRDHLFAEDEPELMSITPATPVVIVKPVSEWRSFALIMLADGVDIDVEPISIRWGANRLNIEDGALGTMPLTFQLQGDRSIFPQEFVSQSRDIALLDGIGRTKGRKGPDTAIIRLKRPSTTLATYDRWVNGPFSKYGAGDENVIREALNKAAKRATGIKESGNDRLLDDPAVEALVLEVVRLFPERSIDQPPMVLNALSDLKAILGNKQNSYHGDDIATVRITLDEKRGPLNGAAKVVSDALGTSMELARGCIYELRIYGAAPLAQPSFAPDSVPKKVLTRDRFAPAAAVGWRDVKIGGEGWHLGAPLVLTVEVACEIMPELYIEQDPMGEVTSPVPMAFSMELVRPPKSTRERAVVRLEPSFMPLPPDLSVSTGNEARMRYAALRYLDRVALLEQRWSWRGRPHPEIPVSVIKTFGQNREIDEAAKFVDSAFIGRSDDDIGPIHEMRITRAHAYGGRTTFDSISTKKAPIVLERELDYRGGANLWRFALRAKSRYAAMRPNDPQLIRFSHQRNDLPQTQWWPFIVPDRANPNIDNRKLQRPGLMLVVPLTETLMAEGPVPPLLALFNEPMFPLAHAGDGIEAVVEVARHPFIGVERIRENMKIEFAAKWHAVEVARYKVAEAQVVLDGLLMIDADPLDGDVASAKTALSTAQRDTKSEEEAYAKFHSVAVAWGYVDQLESVHKRVAETQKEQQDLLDAEKVKPIIDPIKIELLEKEIDRLDGRLKQLVEEIKLARSAAVKVESNPAPAGDALRTGSPFVKHWPEFAPDPIRTGQGATGEPLALRCDGPVGYTFDLETEAGRFDHAGILVSPVADKVRPWSLVKLRFRRIEAPELLVDSAGNPLAQLFAPSLDADIPSSFPIASAIADPGLFPQTLHEGLVFDIVELSPERLIDLRLSLDRSERNSASVEAHYVRIEAKINGSGTLGWCLEIKTRTQLGDAERWSMTFDPGARVQLRLVVSQRPKPEDDGEYHPVADVSIRARILRIDAYNSMSRPGENAWMSVICMPLTARDSVTHDMNVLVGLSSLLDPPIEMVARPVRLSDFTPGVWCQFTAAMSRVIVEAEIKTSTGSRQIRQLIPVDRLTAKKETTGATLSLGIAGLRSEEKVLKIALTAEGAPDRTDTESNDHSFDAQVEERLYAIVTRYVYDAFDRVRERPVAVHKLLDVQAAPLLGDTTWLSGPRDTLYAQGKGRVRILRVLRGRARNDKGFEPVLREFPEGFFGTGADGLSTDEPLDAAGQIIGISPPFEWSAD